MRGVILYFVVLLFATLSFGELAQRLGPPALVGELAAAMILGVVSATYESGTEIGGGHDNYLRLQRKVRTDHFAVCENNCRWTGIAYYSCVSKCKRIESTCLGGATAAVWNCFHLCLPSANSTQEPESVEAP